ncbi:hypothetical protein [Paenibacillus sp. FSL H3-0469]|uniref:hypothetical protein n=1 Tax=Paenibacillus sp. FSL H3-0469 TaxID=2954506 RepID=UPI00310131DA
MKAESGALVLLICSGGLLSANSGALVHLTIRLVPCAPTRTYATALRNVIGFSITFAPLTSTLRNVIGFSITFAPLVPALCNVIGFSITFGPRSTFKPTTAERD